MTFFGPYGGALQCYALQRVLRSMGHEVHVINRKWGEFKSENRKLAISDLKQKLHNTIVSDPFLRFYKRNYSFTEAVCSEKNLENLGTKKNFDIIIVGSDQPWNPDCIKTMGYYFYLDWVSPEVKKYAYAVSYGKDYFPATEEEIKAIKAILETYKAISVREKSGIVISKNLFGIDAKQCLDPTLLLTGNDYASLIVDKQLSQDYICEFFLDPTLEKYQFVSVIAETEHLKIVDNNPPMPKNKIQRYFYRRRSISQWLRNIRDSKYVITDSFHGTVFSLLFHKRFISINNKKRGAARFESLLSMTGLLDHLQDIDNVAMEATYSILREDIDYDKVDAVLSGLKQTSLSFLKEIR